MCLFFYGVGGSVIVTRIVRLIFGLEPRLDVDRQTECAGMAKGTDLLDLRC